MTSENAEKWMPRSHRPVPLGVDITGATVCVVGFGVAVRGCFAPDGFAFRGAFEVGAVVGVERFSGAGAVFGSVGRFGMAPPGWTDDTDAGPAGPSFIVGDHAPATCEQLPSEQSRDVSRCGYQRSATRNDSRLARGTWATRGEAGRTEAPSRDGGLLVLRVGYAVKRGNALRPA
ncbi:hypothetical protein GCM10009543_02820 [Leifsonia naganoensis]